MDSLIVKYATVVLRDGEVQIPKELSHLPFEDVVVVPMSDFMAKLEQYVQNEYAVLVTNSESTARCALALNMTLKSHYIIVIRNGIVDASAALKEFEILERQIVDKDGNEYLLTNPLVSGVYPTENGRVVCKTEFLVYDEFASAVNVFYKNNGEKAGLLLSEEYQANLFTGTLDEYVPSSVDEGISFLNELLEICNMEIPELLLMFGEKKCVVNVKLSASCDEKKKFVYRVLFGADIADGNVVGHIIDMLSRKTLPDYFLDTVDAQFISNQEISLGVWKNVVERYIMEMEEK